MRLKKTIGYLFFLAAAGLFIGTLYILAISHNLPDPSSLNDRQVHQSTKIYDRTGKTILYEIYNDKKRTLVSLDDLPPFVVNATLAIEDKNFYEHGGIAWKSLARAFVSDILGRKIGSGGASTLTQQLVKNAIVGNERSLTRKIKEALLALKIEREYSKKQILELYFNEIPYGSTNYGVESASTSYFGVHAKDLNVAQAATLAAMVQAPTHYLNNLDTLTSRRNYVLDLMVSQGYLTKEDAAHAKQEKVVISHDLAGSLAPHFVMMVKEQLVNTFGEQTVDEGGLSVVTTLDIDKQKIAEDEVSKGVAFNRKNYNAYNAALLALDVKTGQMLAYVGSADYHATSSLPYGCAPGVSCKFDPKVDVVRKPRQPGSSFKPFVYLAGFLKGFTPETILYDVTTVFKNIPTDYVPHDYDGKERGPITIRKALQGSLNIPAVKMLYLVGIDTTLNFAQQFGYSTFTDRSRFGLSLVLGGGEVTLLDHTTAYASLARGGSYLPPVSILKVTASDGSTLFESKDVEAKSVADPDAVATLTNVLSDNASRVYVFGANNPLQLPDRPVAAKTGTTNDYKDGWVMGFTPSLAVGVWAGNNDNTQMNRAGGSLAGGTIWHNTMQRMLANTPVEQFPALPATKSTNPILLGQDPGYQELEIDSVSGKLATEFTPDETRVKKKYFASHDILFYINKDDPNGPPPTDPSQDPQFANWERAVADWASRQGLSTETPPTESDDVHKPELRPSVSLITPTQGQSVGRSIAVSASASAPNGVARVRYFMDGVQLGESTESPSFTATLSLGQFTTGFHSLTAAAYDGQWNKGTTSVDVSVTGEADPPTAVWEYPPPHALIGTSDFPLQVRASFTMPERISAATLVVSGIGGAPSTVASIGSPGTGMQTATVPNAFKTAGTYSFSWNITYDDGRHTVSPPLSIVFAK